MLSCGFYLTSGRFMNRPYGQKNNQRQHVDDFDITSFSFVGEGSPLPKEKQMSIQKTGGAFSLRLGHARVLTPHRGVIHCARAASLRLPYNQILHQINTTIKFPFRIGVLMRFKNFACRDRRPRRSENERILKLHPAIICSHIKSKICCFPDRRGRRSLQGLRGIGRKSVATKFTVTFIVDRRGLAHLDAEVVIWFS